MRRKVSAPLIPIQKMKLLPFGFGFPSYRFFYPFSKFLIPKDLKIFYYNPTELIEKFHGPTESIFTRLILSLRRGRRARQILYPFLEKFGPTESIASYLLKK